MAINARRLVAPCLATCLVVLALPALAELDMSARPPQDPAVLTGVLDNGLTYFIRRVEKPEKRIEMRLAVKVGSVQETEEERGLAHFNEHMAFNGSKNFKPDELIAWLESIGTRFGADSNAYTSYDETVYMLQVPTDKEGAVDKAMLAMADWAGRATLSDAEIDKERGVVQDELRRGKGARKRIRDKQDQVMFEGSRYADRSTIGLEKVITDAPHDALRGFYTKWYRPDVMAFIVAGDFDAKQMEEQVKRVFSELPKPATPTVVATFPVPPHADTLYSVESDKELTSSSVQIYYKRDRDAHSTIGDERAGAVRSIAGGLLGMRLFERAQKADPPFLSAGAGSFDYVKTLSVFMLSARAKDGTIPQAASALMEELERARQHGFVQAELDRVRTSALEQSESRLKESAQWRSDERIGGMVQAFLEGDVLPSDRWEYDTTKELIPSITLDEVNAAMRSMTDTKSRVVLVQVPLKEGAPVPTVDEMRAAVEPPAGFQVAAYVDDLAGKELITEVPAGGHVTSRRSFPEVGAEELTLSNGVRVVLKATDFRADEISLSGLAQGGASDFGDAMFPSAIRADTLASDSGVADFTLPQLQKWLTAKGKLANAGPSVDNFTRGFEGGARPQDLETMLQLVYLYFTKPAFREEAFKRMIDSQVESIKNELNSPQGVYGRTIRETAFSGHWLFKPPTVELVTSLKQPDLERCYRQMFDDGSEWTFILVGNLDMKKHVPLIEQWLGAIPSSATAPKVVTRPAYADLKIDFPKGSQVKDVRKGIEDQSRTQYMLKAAAQLDPQAEFDINAITDLLQIRLREKLREELGETYGAGAGYFDLSPYRDYGRITVSFTGSPDTRASMMDIVRSSMASMRTTAPTEADMKKLREMRLNYLDEAEKENGYWSGNLWEAYLLGREPKTILEQRPRIMAMSAEGLHRAAIKWFDPADTLEIYLVPENWQPKPATVTPPVASSGSSNGN
jgi:zinc protease